MFKDNIMFRDNSLRELFSKDSSHQRPEAQQLLIEIARFQQDINLRLQTTSIIRDMGIKTLVALWNRGNFSLIAFSGDLMKFIRDRGVHDIKLTYLI